MLCYTSPLNVKVGVSGARKWLGRQLKVEKKKQNKQNKAKKMF